MIPSGRIGGRISSPLIGSRLAGARRTPSRARCGATLIELLVVIFIIGILLSLLLPALQSARAKATTVQCQNNVRQVGFAVSRYIDSWKKFPQPGRWTVNALKYMEEWDLADQIPAVIPKNAVYSRPRLFSCPAQPEVESGVEGVKVCHYVLVVDRPLRDKPDKVHWELHDREDLSNADPNSFAPWYIGPEITFAVQKKWFELKSGPHPSGVFYDSNGQVRPED